MNVPKKTTKKPTKAAKPSPFIQARLAEVTEENRRLREQLDRHDERTRYAENERVRADQDRYAAVRKQLDIARERDAAVDAVHALEARLATLATAAEISDADLDRLIRIGWPNGPDAGTVFGRSAGGRAAGIEAEARTAVHVEMTRRGLLKAVVPTLKATPPDVLPPEAPPAPIPVKPDAPPPPTTRQIVPILNHTDDDHNDFGDPPGMP